MNNSREKRLIKNTFIISLGKVSTQFITFLLLPLYTGVLSTKEYGVVDLLNTLVFLLLPIMTLQIERAVFRDLIECRQDEKRKTKTISNGLSVVICQILLFLLLFLLTSQFINNDYKVFLLMNLVVYTFSTFFLQIARGFGDNKSYSIASFINAATTILFNVLFITVIKLGAYGMLLGTFLGQLSCVIYLLIRLRLYVYIRFGYIDYGNIKRMLIYSLPLIPNAISWWIFNTSDRVIVSVILGLDANGLLSIASKFSVILVGIYNIFDLSWTESISLHINDLDIKEYFQKTFSVILRFFTSASILMIAFMPIIFRIMVNSKFNGGYFLIPILLLATIFTIIIGLISTIYIAKKDTKSIATTSIFAAMVNIITHLLLIKFIGLYAAVVSTFVSYLTLAVYRLYDIQKKYFKISFDKKYFISLLLVLLIIIPLYYINNPYLNFISYISAIVYAYFINKYSYKLILKMFFLKLNLKKKE